jgi:hypothetical protein
VTDFFAAYGPQSVVVNGVAVGSISHVTCTRLMYTGALVEGSADMASWIGAGRGAGQILPNLILSGPRFPGAFGASAIPLSSLLFGVAQGQSPAGAAYVADDEAAIRDWLRGEAEGLRFPGASALGADLVTGLGRRAGLEAVAGEFDGYTGVTEAEQVGAALTALSLGLSRCVCLEGDVPGFGQWDSHQDNAGNQSRCYEHLFGRLSTLMAGLSATAGPAGGSLLDQTTVLVLSEMGRTPVENAAGGKDHWPYTSALLVGAGLDGGRVVGATDDSLVGLAVDPEDGLPTEAGARIGPAELLAGLLERFDIDPDPIWPGVRPLRAPWCGCGWVGGGLWGLGEGRPLDGPGPPVSSVRPSSRRVGPWPLCRLRRAPCFTPCCGPFILVCWASAAPSARSPCCPRRPWARPCPRWR